VFVHPDLFHAALSILLHFTCVIADHPHIEVSRLTLESPEKSYILIGVLYKDQRLKPSLLRDLSKELQLEAQPSSNCASVDDKLFLEDETLRVRLVGSHMDVQEIVTGLVCAVLGHELENGNFWVYTCVISLQTEVQLADIELYS
jgi:hypothetical protein